jgi:glycosyltransferase involved in cell wall biosynthesis
MTLSHADLAIKDRKPIAKRRLRVAVLSRNFRSSGGGAERYSMALVEQMAESHEIHVFAQEIEHQCQGVVYHNMSMPLRKPRWINQLWFALATWWATRRGFDLVHSHENSWHGQVQTVHVLPIKYDLFHGLSRPRLALRWLKVISSPRLLAYLWLEKLRYRVDGKRTIVLTSQRLFSIMAQTYPNSSAVTEVVNPGVARVSGPTIVGERLALRKLLGLPEQGKCILFVGNNFRKKGLPTLLEAMRYLPDNAYLAVVGQDEGLAQFKADVQTSGLRQRVFFLGALKDVEPAYRAADCLVHPTLEDTFAMVVLEAMSYGVPVVVSGPAYCGISQQLINGSDAFLLDNPKDPILLSKLMDAVLSDLAVADHLRRHGLAFAAAHSWECAALQYEVFYQLAVRLK